MSATPIIETAEHPCFNPAHAAQASRIHLPVAPRCNVQCRFCDRAFDCMNESRPGVTARLLTPEEAVERLSRLRKSLPSLTVAGIAGPGDPLANPEETFRTLSLVRRTHPDLLLCLATNGLSLPECVDDLVGFGVSHLTVTVNAVRPEIGSRIYSWIRSSGRAVTGFDAAALLWEKQREGIIMAASLGIIVKINTILVPGVNDGEIGSIARETADLGARYMNLIPLLPVKGTPLGACGEPPATLVGLRRKEAAVYLPQLSHCRRCRADAAGLLGQDLPSAVLNADPEVPRSDSSEPSGCRSACTLASGKKTSAAETGGTKRPQRIAVTSREGLFINMHLGEADRVYVFTLGGDGFLTEDIRGLPGSGGGEERWERVGELLSDCELLLTSGIGAPPKRLLESRGIRILEAGGLISQSLAAVSAGREPMSSGLWRTGSGCSGGAVRGCGCA